MILPRVSLPFALAAAACAPGEEGAICLRDFDCADGFACDVPADNPEEGTCSGVAPEEAADDATHREGEPEEGADEIGTAEMSWLTDSLA